MRQPALVHRITRTRPLWSIAAVLVLCVSAALPASVALGRIDPADPGRTATLGPNMIGIVTGGGTVKLGVFPDEVLASFGINAKRPTGFVQDGTGAALGRINYNKHAQVAGRHVNVPVTFMQLELSATPSPNGTGGKAQLIGDCTQAGVECPTTPPGIRSVLVYVEDNSDTGAGDVFQISFCTDGPSAAPVLCGAAEGGTIRTGNIQIRPGASGGAAPTAARAPRLRP